MAPCTRAPHSLSGSSAPRASTRAAPTARADRRASTRAPTTTRPWLRTPARGRTRHLVATRAPTPSPYEILVKTTHHYPIYFFIHSSGLSKDQIIDIIDKRPDKDIKASTKQKIIEKLSSGTIIVQPSYKIWRMPSIEINLESDIYTQIEDIKRDHNIKVSKRDRSIIRTYLFQQLINRAEINEIILDNFFCELVEAISCGLEQPDLDMAYTCRLLDRIYNHVNMKGNIKSVFRKLICIIDEKLYGPLAPRLSNP